MGLGPDLGGVGAGEEGRGGGFAGARGATAAAPTDDQEEREQDRTNIFCFGLGVVLVAWVPAASRTCLLASGFSSWCLSAPHISPARVGIG
jgi:hypothetical protein